MNNSQIKKIETNIDDLTNLWNRRKGVCIIVILIIVFGGGAWIWLQFNIIPKLKNDNEKLISDLANEKRFRDKAEIQLAPFIALAKRQFPEAPSEQRLKLLMKEIERLSTNIQDMSKELKQLKKLIGPVGNYLINVDLINFESKKGWSYDDGIFHYPSLTLFTDLKAFSKNMRLRIKIFNPSEKDDLNVPIAIFIRESDFKETAQDLMKQITNEQYKSSLHERSPISFNEEITLKGFRITQDLIEKKQIFNFLWLKLSLKKEYGFLAVMVRDMKYFFRIKVHEG